jgi:transketolase
MTPAAYRLPPTASLPNIARQVRRYVVQMVANARSSHVGSALSIADILTVLYFRTLKVFPDDPWHEDRDRFILSKGHACTALYATLALRGFFPEKVLDTYCANGTSLPGHSTMHSVPGVEVSTGSLGHGLSLGCGLALAARRAGQKHRVVVLLSDGECDEGSTWEAALFAGHHKLDNLTAIVDFNRIQAFGNTSDILNLEPFADKWTAFGWETKSVNGHDLPALEAALAPLPFRSGKPSLLIARTVKGKGVSFMENQLAWHYKSPNPVELEAALKELA